MSIPVLLLSTLAMSWVFGMLLKHVALKRLAYTRCFAKPAYSAGEYAELVEVIRNDRPMIVPWLRVESRIPASMRFGAADNLSVQGQMYHRSVFFLSPFQQITRRHRVLLTRRGEFDIGNATLTLGDVLGLLQCQRELHGSARVLVYPKLLSDEEMPSPFKRLIGECVVRRSLLTDPYQVTGIRPYRMGDSLRAVHWPATARMQELHVRTFAYTSETNLLVIVNSQTRDDQWDNISDDEQPVIEQAISMAATLCVRVLRAGLAAGFAANMPLEKDSRESTVVQPGGDAAQEEAILSTMARLRILRTQSFPELLKDLRSLSGMDMLVLSPYDSLSIRKGLHALEACGNSVRLYVMGEGEVRLDGEGMG